jgi:hypothetical protein
VAGVSLPILDRGTVAPVIDADIHAAYAAAHALSDIPRVLAAQSLRRDHDPAFLLGVAERAAAGDFAPLFERQTYAHLGLSLCEVVPNRTWHPIEIAEVGRNPRFVVAPSLSPVPLSYTWPDFVLSAVLSERVTELCSFTRLVPWGHVDVSKPRWITKSVHRRDAAKDRLRAGTAKADDARLKVALHPIINSGAWGNFARADQHRVGQRQVEEVAEWSWPPIAATMPALCRLWLAMVLRWVRDRGGACLSWDTDGVTVLATREGGKFELKDGRVVHILTWNDVDDFLARFDALDPFGDGRPFWEVER